MLPDTLDDASPWSATRLVCRLLALSVISLSRKKWSLLGHSGHWPRLTLNGSAAIDPKQTLTLVEPSLPHALQITLHQLWRLIGNACPDPIE